MAWIYHVPGKDSEIIDTRLENLLTGEHPDPNLIACWFSALVLFLSLLVVDEVIKYTCGVFVAVNYLENRPTFLRGNFLKLIH